MGDWLQTHLHGRGYGAEISCCLSKCDTLQKGSISLHLRINAFNCVKPTNHWMLELLGLEHHHLDVFCIGVEVCLGRQTLLGLM